MPAAHPFKAQRSPRVKLLGSVLALLRFDDGQQIRARIHQLSSNGGVLQTRDALCNGASIRLIFHVRSATLQTAAEMLPPMWCTSGNLQPFRFLHLTEAERFNLGRDISLLLRRSSVIIHRA